MNEPPDSETGEPDDGAAHSAADRLPAYDRAQALRATGDSADIADQLLERFLAELPATGRRLQAAWEAGDWEDLWGLAHRVRGASAICATTALSAVVEELERHIRARERDPARRAIAAFRRQAKRLADGIADPRR